MHTPDNQPLPEILAGPIVRHVSEHETTFWLITSSSCTFEVLLQDKASNACFFKGEVSDAQLTQVQVGKHAFVTLIHLTFDQALPTEQPIEYDIGIQPPQQTTRFLQQTAPKLTYDGHDLPFFRIPKVLTHVLHGSCRKPHFDSPDGLLRVDKQIEDTLDVPEKQPDLLIMSGDQVYADDVAGPMLTAIHQTIELLGLFEETIEGALVSHSSELKEHPYGYYQRPMLLPEEESNEGFYATFFKAKKKPLFTSVNANNHLISFAEVMAMYILVWSDTIWPLINTENANISPRFTEKYQHESKVLDNFQSTLVNVRRALAHIPVYMIFDDHDITDDWNLTRGWEESVYSNPFGKRIIGNALIGYLLCQGWANHPTKFLALKADVSRYFQTDGLYHQDELIDRLMDWSEWHYQLETSPKVLVLDTRTQRWRSESSLNKPSGLMDWEALCEMQQSLIGQKSVIMVSAAPIFGVKLIETVQKIFTFFGKALTVDAENWMAHKGTASVILNIFRHHKTPPHFIILSGDVHYSFVYDVSLRFRRNSPRIVQFTSSGIKNQFPEGLLRWFDKLNRIMYARRSPLNWFTQRRYMRIRARKPEGEARKTLLNNSGIGLVELTPGSRMVVAKHLGADGDDRTFVRPKKNDVID